MKLKQPGTRNPRGYLSGSRMFQLRRMILQFRLQAQDLDPKQSYP